MADRGFHWYDRYKGLGIYNDNDQISTKATKTRRYIDETEKQEKKKTVQRLDNARKQRQGYAKQDDRQDIEKTRKKVADAFAQARPGRFR